MKEETTRLSASLEDYLKEIYLLNLEGQEVRITDIARSWVSPSQVSTGP